MTTTKPALHWAASSGKSLCVSALLRADDVDPDVVNAKGAFAEDWLMKTTSRRGGARFRERGASAPQRDGRLATLRRALSEKLDVARRGGRAASETRATRARDVVDRFGKT